MLLFPCFWMAMGLFGFRCLVTPFCLRTILRVGPRREMEQHLESQLSFGCRGVGREEREMGRVGSVEGCGGDGGGVGEEEGGVL